MYPEIKAKYYVRFKLSLLFLKTTNQLYACYTNKLTVERWQDDQYLVGQAKYVPLRI